MRCLRPPSRIAQFKKDNERESKGRHGVTPQALDLLLGSQARHVLAAAIGGYGGQLENARVADVDVHPGGAGVVTYASTVVRADGRRTNEILVAVTGSRIPPGAAVIEGEHLGEPVQVGIWRWPEDPELPALARCADPYRLAQLFREFDLSTGGFALDIDIRTYRPMTRAVLEVTAGPYTRFIKVVRPSALAGLRTRHALTCQRLPVPPIVGSTADGLVVLRRVDGTLMRSAIRSGDRLPTPDALEKLLDLLPDDLMSLPPQSCHLQRFPWYVDVLRCTARTEPMVLERLDQVVEGLYGTDSERDATVPVHGDFYDRQILVDDGRVTGLLDIDAAGPGHRIDDWATLLAHLSGLTLLDGWRGPAKKVAAGVVTQARRCASEAALRRHTAAALVGFATGPFQAQERDWPRHTAARLELAAHWLSGSVHPS
jgi:hypothetical protein